MISQKPIIGITPSHNTENNDTSLRPGYPRAIAAAGGLETAGGHVQRLSFFRRPGSAPLFIGGRDTSRLQKCIPGQGFHGNPAAPCGHGA